MTVEELSRFDGREGRPAYVAFKGKVYDVSDSFLWQGGRHEAMHEAGKDLTDELPSAPHDESTLEAFPEVARLLPSGA
jgi:predicted heme/steroid binding protein